MSFMEPKTRTLQFVLERNVADPMHVIKVAELYPDKTWTQWTGWRMRLLTWLVIRWVGRVDNREGRHPIEMSKL